MSTKKITVNLKNLSEGFTFTNRNEIWDFFLKINPSMERGLTFK